MRGRPPFGRETVMRSYRGFARRASLRPRLRSGALRARTSDVGGAGEPPVAQRRCPLGRGSASEAVIEARDVGGGSAVSVQVPVGAGEDIEVAGVERVEERLQVGVGAGVCVEVHIAGAPN